MLPQPPPDAPAPPPSEAALLSRRKWKWLWVVGAVSIIIVLAGLTTPVTIRSRRRSDQTEAVSNARQIGLALLDFENEYGAYPDTSTISRVKEKTKTNLNLST